MSFPQALQTDAGFGNNGLQGLQTDAGFGNNGCKVCKPVRVLQNDCVKKLYVLQTECGFNIVDLQTIISRIVHLGPSKQEVPPG